MKHSINLKILVSLTFYMACMVSSKGRAEIFTSTVYGNSKNPKVCALVFINACDRAVANCEAARQSGNDELSCQEGCSITSQEPEPSLPGSFGCTVTAQLDAPNVKFKKIGNQPKVGSLLFESARECNKMATWMLTHIPYKTAFTNVPNIIRAKCDNNLLKINLIPLVERLRVNEFPLGMVYDGLSKGECLKASTLLAQVESNDFVLNPMTACEADHSHKWFQSDYQFTLNVFFK
jgi:hypothetical protein